jgi:hypothetical protein
VLRTLGLDAAVYHELIDGCVVKDSGMGHKRNMFEVLSPTQVLNGCETKPKCRRGTARIVQRGFGAWCWGPEI